MVRINPELIPETETKLLAMALLDAMRRFYSDQKNEEKFQEWQKRRQEEKILVGI